MKLLDMASTSRKTKRTENRNCCVLCSCQLFLFERKIRYADLDERETTACATLMNSASELRTAQNCDKRGILCLSCYQKVQESASSGDCGDSGNQTFRRHPYSGTIPNNSQKKSTPVPPRNKDHLQTIPKVTATAAAERRVQSSSGDLESKPENDHKSAPEDATKRALTGFLSDIAMPPWVITGFMNFVAGTVVVLGVIGTWMAFPAVVMMILLGVIVVVCAKHWNLLQRWFQAFRCLLDTDGKLKENDVPVIPSATVVGNSLAGTSLMSLLQDGYRVNCGIEVENWTQFPLVEPCVQLSRGTLSLAPCNIAPATREAMVARKHSGLAEGTCGTVSWLIQPMNRRLVIMWSAPFNFDFYSNWMAVGLTGVGITMHAPGDAWFHQMYNCSSTKELEFKRREYCADIHPVVCRDDDFEVEGTMGTDHNAAIRVILRPRDPNCLAPSIKRKMSAT